MSDKENFKLITLPTGRDIEVGDCGTIQYTGTTDGNVYSTSGSVRNGGYLQIALNGRYYAVNRLVAKAWLDDSLELDGTRKLNGENIDVCHIDGNRQNNHLYNLAIKSHKDNCNEPDSRYRYTLANRKLKCGYKQVKCIDPEGKEHTFDNWNDVAKFVNRPKSLARANVQGSIKTNGTAYGCKWSKIREDGWYKGKNTKYYRRKDGTRPFYTPQPQHRDIPADQLEAMTPADILDYYGK